MKYVNKCFLYLLSEKSAIPKTHGAYGEVFQNLFQSSSIQQVF